jgi:hypothetical protein
MLYICGQALANAPYPITVPLDPESKFYVHSLLQIQRHHVRLSVQKVLEL